ncbi:hypothetical protein IWZ03DRAFT_207 [Phyllosticta citriasiana]|uniref:Uncharacterized protein n=1 Tax=Phyllosticta citriasiana TaxID=595635 RepID=A0ABR1KXD3_9PEZI
MVCKSANFLKTFSLPSFLGMACSSGPWHQAILFNVTMPRPLGTYTYTYTTQRCRLFRVCRDDATSDAASLTERWQSKHTHILPLGEVCAGNRRRRVRVVVSRRCRWVRRKRTSWTCVKWLDGCLGLCVHVVGMMCCHVHLLPVSFLLLFLFFLLFALHNNSSSAEL